MLEPPMLHYAVIGRFDYDPLPTTYFFHLDAATSRDAVEEAFIKMIRMDRDNDYDGVIVEQVLFSYTKIVPYK